jgi:hypothetical protein
MKKLIFRLLAVLLSIYVAGAVLPLLASEGGHSHTPTPSTPPPAPPPVTPGGTPPAQLGTPGKPPAGVQLSDDAWIDEELNKPKTKLGIPQQRKGTTCD